MKICNEAEHAAFTCCKQQSLNSVVLGVLKMYTLGDFLYEIAGNHSLKHIRAYLSFFIWTNKYTAIKWSNAQPQLT